MLIGTIIIKVFIPSAHSLKDKRRVTKSLLSKLQNKFNISAAEIDFLDQWQLSLIGMAIVGNETKHLDRQISRIVEFVQQEQYQFQLLEVNTEII